WTSPSAGVINIAGGVWSGRDIGRGNHWELLKNGDPLTGGDIFDGDPYNSANPFTYNLGDGGLGAVNNIAVASGDVIESQLSPTTEIDYVGVKLAITEDVSGVVPIAAKVGGLDPAFGVNGLVSHNLGLTSTSDLLAHPADSKSIIVGTAGSSPARQF